MEMNDPSYAAHYICGWPTTHKVNWWNEDCELIKLNTYISWIIQIKKKHELFRSILFYCNY